MIFPPREKTKTKKKNRLLGQTTQNTKQDMSGNKPDATHTRPFPQTSQIERAHRQSDQPRLDFFHNQLLMMAMCTIGITRSTIPDT